MPEKKKTSRVSLFLDELRAESAQTDEQAISANEEHVNTNVSQFQNPAGIDPFTGKTPITEGQKKSVQEPSEDVLRRVVGGTIGAAGGAVTGGVPGMVLGGTAGMAFPPESTAEGVADVSGAVATALLDRVAPGSGMAAAQLRRYLGKEGMKQAAKKGVLEAGMVGAAQVPLWATGQSDPGTAASFMAGEVGGSVFGAGVGRAVASAFGLTRPDDVVRMTNRIRQRTGKFGETFGTRVESGGRGTNFADKLLRGMPFAGGLEREESRLQALMMRGLDAAGAVGEVPITKASKARAEQEFGAEFADETSLEEIQDKVIKRVTNEMIEVTPAQKVKKPAGRDPLTGQVNEWTEETIPAVKRSIEEGDIIAVDPKTGRVFATAPDQPLPKAADDLPKFRVDKKELKQLINFARSDPGRAATIIGTSNRALPLVAAMRHFLSEKEFKAVQKDWLGFHLVADALKNTSKREGGFNIQKELGRESAQVANQFMEIDGRSLAEAWDGIKTQKAIMMLDKDQVDAIDDVIGTVRELGIGMRSDLSRTDQILSYAYNKLIFSGLSMGAGGGIAAASGAAPLAGALAGGATIVMSVTALASAALTNPGFAKAVKAAGRGDVHAARQAIRMAASNPNLLPIMHDDNTLEFVNRPEGGIPESEKALPFEFKRKDPQKLEKLVVR